MVLVKNCPFSSTCSKLSEVSVKNYFRQNHFSYLFLFCQELQKRSLSKTLYGSHKQGWMVELWWSSVMGMNSSCGETFCLMKCKCCNSNPFYRIFDWCATTFWSTSRTKFVKNKLATTLLVHCKKHSHNKRWDWILAGTLLFVTAVDCVMDCNFADRY